MSNMSDSGDRGSSRRTTTEGTARQARDTVREKAKNVAGAAKEKASDAYEQKKNVVFDQVSGLAAALRETGDKLRSQGNGGVAAQVTDRVADRLEAVTNRMAGKDLDGIVRDVENFGRSNPAMFLGVAAALGFLAIRFVKSSAQRSSDGQWGRDGRWAREQTDISSTRSPLVSHAEEP